MDSFCIKLNMQPKTAHNLPSYKMGIWALDYILKLFTTAALKCKLFISQSSGSISFSKTHVVTTITDVYEFKAVSFL